MFKLWQSLLLALNYPNVWEVILIHVYCSNFSAFVLFTVEFRYYLLLTERLTCIVCARKWFKWLLLQRLLLVGRVCGDELETLHSVAAKYGLGSFMTVFV